MGFSLVKFKDNYRSSDNAELVYGAVLDFDTLQESGLITYERVKEILGPVECFIYSTYSGGFKRRVIILFKEPAEPEEAKPILIGLYNKFESAFPDCMIDKKSYNLSQPWLLPCKDKDGNYFAEVHEGKLFDNLKFLTYSVPFGMSNEQFDFKTELVEPYKPILGSIEEQEKLYSNPLQVVDS